MKHDKDGTEEEIFFDSYAILAIALGDPQYKWYTEGVRVITTLMNLYESYYILLQRGLTSESEKVFDKFLQCCIPIDPGLVKKAAQFRLANVKKKFSYVDALGYTISQDRGISFLTGDLQFKGLPEVNHVKGSL